MTGTDENSQKNVEALRLRLRAPRLRSGNKITKEEIQEYLNEMAAVWQEVWDSLGISNDDFIRTTEERHIKAVNKFFKEAQKTGDIYEGTYEGYYCEGCEAFLTKDDLAEGKCAIHQKEPKYLKEKNLFFRLTKYRKKLLAHIKKHPNFIEPASRRNEVVSYIKNYMSDFSITRENAEWGILVPTLLEQESRIPKPEPRKVKSQGLKVGGQNRVLYVWFDALINYISAVGYGTEAKKFKKWWPADAHLIGKDIIKFHCAYWPAMLMSVGIALPKKVFAHGFFTVEGQKMSKSLGNVIDPIGASRKYGIDTLRYFLIHEIKFGEDGDFSFSRLEEVYNSELANELGNLVNRVLVMTEKYFNGLTPKIPISNFQFPNKIQNLIKDYDEAMRELRLHDAVESILSLVRYCNQLIDKERPWEMYKNISLRQSQALFPERSGSGVKGSEQRLFYVIYYLLDSLRLLGWMLWPITPETAEKIWEQLGVLVEEKRKKWEKGKKAGGLKSGVKIKKGETLFPKLT